MCLLKGQRCRVTLLGANTLFFFFFLHFGEERKKKREKEVGLFWREGGVP